MRRKIRTFFTVMSILVAFVLFGVLMAIRAAFSFGVEVAGADRLMVIHKVSIIQPLPQSYGEPHPRHRRRQGSDLLQLVRRLLPGDPEHFIQSMAVDPESWLRMYPEFELPDGSEERVVQADRTGAVVGADLGEAVRLEGRRPRSDHARPIYRKPERRPVGVHHRRHLRFGQAGRRQDAVLLPLCDTSTRRSADTGFMADQVGWYIIKVADPSTSDQLAKRIDAMFANSPAETKTATEKSFVADFAKQIGDIGSAS